jgi:hypothetical protein
MEGSSQAHEVTLCAQLRERCLYGPGAEPIRAPSHQLQSRAADCAGCQAWGNAAGADCQLESRGHAPVPVRIGISDAASRSLQLST